VNVNFGRGIEIEKRKKQREVEGEGEGTRDVAGGERERSESLIVSIVNVIVVAAGYRSRHPQRGRILSGV